MTTARLTLDDPTLQSGRPVNQVVILTGQGRKAAA